MNMSKQLKGSLYYLFANLRFSLIIFWIILGTLLLLTVVSAILIPDSVISFSLWGPIYGFAAVIGYWTVKNTLPFLIKMGSTRKNLFVSMGLYAIGLSLLNAFIANTLNSIVTLTIGEEREIGSIFVSDSGSTMTFNHIGEFLGKNTWLMRVFIDTSISFFLLAAMFIVGLIFFRSGIVGGFSFLGAFVLLFIFGMSKGWLLDFFITIYNNFSFAFFYQLLLTGIVIYLISFLL